MFKIAICDDNSDFCSLLSNKLLQVMNNESIDIYTFNNGDNLVKKLDNGSIKPDVVMMDIKLSPSGKTGIDYARYINNHAPECQIVFITEFLQYAMDVYRTEHTYFVLKSALDEYLPLVFDKIRKRSKMRTSKLILSQKDRQLVITSGELMYLERNLHKTTVHCKSGIYYTAQKLSELIQQLPPLCLLQCHKSYAVNLEYVREFLRTDFVLSDGTSIPISRGYYEQVKKAFADFCGV